jgi:hypothetical protein
MGAKRTFAVSTNWRPIRHPRPIGLIASGAEDFAFGNRDDEIVDALECR